MDITGVTILVWGLAAAGGVVYLLVRNAKLSGRCEQLDGQLAKKEEELRETMTQLQLAKEEQVRLDAMVRAANESLAQQQVFLRQARDELRDAFGALSADALRNNNLSFIELAKARLEEKFTDAKGTLEQKEQAIATLVKPLGESLQQMETRIRELEDKRLKAYRDIWHTLDQVRQTTEGLKKETVTLSGALKSSHVRGRYGEIALRRLVEHAGMLDHCHFEEQVSVAEGEGRLRPDMIIRLPGGRTLVVDSKVPLAAYLRMCATEDADEQKLCLTAHVTAVRDHLRKLGAKSYWSQFSEAPDFVIMYMHIEPSYSSAMQAYPDLIEEAMRNRIIIATPTVLLSVLMGAGYSWSQVKTMEHIELIRTAAVELHDRAAVLTQHLAGIGKGLNSVLSHYNNTVGSLEASFLPQARKIAALGKAYVKKEVPELTPVETPLRAIRQQNAGEAQATED